MPEIIEWVEKLPTSKHGGTSASMWEPVVKQLEGKIGVWAKVFEADKKKAESKRLGFKAYIKRAELTGKVEIKLRGNGETAAVYARRLFQG